MIAYKFLRAGGHTLFSRMIWSLPSGTAPGQWVDAAEGPLVACRNGVHACDVIDLPYWLADELWEIELDGEQLRGPDARIARRGRLLRRVAAWTADAKVAYADACATRLAQRVASLPSAVPSRVAEYAEQARTLTDMGYAVAGAYAAALGFAALVPPDDELAAFRAEREQQAHILGRMLGLQAR